jgi:hypothetical protein
MGVGVFSMLSADSETLKKEGTVMNRALVLAVVVCLLCGTALSVSAQQHRVVRKIEVPRWLTVCDLEMSPDGTEIICRGISGETGYLFTVNTLRPREFAFRKIPALMTEPTRTAPRRLETCETPRWSTPDRVLIAAVTPVLGRECITINDTRATLAFDKIVFARNHFQKTGELVFAGYDRTRHQIVLSLHVPGATRK